MIANIICTLAGIGTLAVTLGSIRYELLRRKTS
jgi:hypothetical protein